MAEWEADKEVFIEKLRKAGGTIQSILDKDPGGLVFSLDERMELQELMRRNDKVLLKLQKGEFTVAVVGLEKQARARSEMHSCATSSCRSIRSAARIRRRRSRREQKTAARSSFIRMRNFSGISRRC